MKSKAKGKSTANARRFARGFVQHAALAALGLLFLGPLLWMLSSSLKANDQLFVPHPIWIPHPLRWDNYPKALHYIPFFTYLQNTLFICAMGVAGSLISCSLVAYGFARIDWPGAHRAVDPHELPRGSASSRIQIARAHARARRGLARRDHLARSMRASC